MKRTSVPFIAPKPNSYYDEGVTGAEVLQHNGRLYGYFCGLHDSIENILSCDIVQIGSSFKISAVQEVPCLCCGESDEFDAAGVCDPAVVFFKDQFFMYYSALGKQADTIGVATSKDGKHFKKHFSALFKGRAPGVVVLNEMVHVLYVLDNALGGYDIHLARSKDGVTFETSMEAVIRAGELFFDAKSVSTPRITEINGMYYCFFCSDDLEKDIPKWFSVARSKDLIHWERSKKTLFERSGVDSYFDRDAIWLPSVVNICGRICIWYEGAARESGGTLRSSVGLAEFEQEEILTLF